MQDRQFQAPKQVISIDSFVGVALQRSHLASKRPIIKRNNCSKALHPRDVLGGNGAQAGYPLMRHAQKLVAWNADEGTFP